MPGQPEFGYFSQNRVPANLVGDTFKEVRKTTDNFNKSMMMDQQSNAIKSYTSNFPMTTN